MTQAGVCEVSNIVYPEFSRSELINGATAFEVALSDHQVDNFIRYGELLHEWNQKMNLTRVPPEEFVLLHFIDSLSLFHAIEIPLGGKVLDVGTGAGLPGIPIKIARPDLRVHLLDSLRKRLDFLRLVGQELGLQELHFHHGRAEDLAKERALAGKFDLVTARAVARLDTLLGWLLPFVSVGGYAIALKSQHVEEEILEALDVMEELGGELEGLVELMLPGSEIPRKLIVVRKVKHISLSRRLKDKKKR